MWSRMESYLDAHNDKVSAHADIAALVTVFLSELSTFDALAAQQAAGTGTYADAKKAAIADGAAYISKWGRRCSVQAHTLGLYAVEATINHRAYEITRMASEEAFNLLQAMRDALEQNMASFSTQGITNAVIVQMDAKLTTISGLLTALSRRMTRVSRRPGSSIRCRRR